MKVYAIIYDYQDYEEWVVGIFSTHEKAEEYLIEDFNKNKYTDDIKKYLNDSDYSLVEWELDTNEKKELKIQL